MKTKDVIDGVLRGIDGVESLNAMQEAMASSQEGRVMLIAPTGSGKTIAFAIRLLRNIDASAPGIKGMVIAPTRELVIQIAEVVRKSRVESRESREGGKSRVESRESREGVGGKSRVESRESREGAGGKLRVEGRESREGAGGKLRVESRGSREGVAGLRVVALYGGHRMEDERNTLAGGMPDIVVATPGRLLDHINRGTVDVAQVRSLVLDEFDKSLQLGFQDQMRRIVKKMRRLTLVVLTSATPMPELPEFVGDAAGYRLYDYSGRVVSPEGNTEYYAVESPTKDKLDTLVALLRSMDAGKAIVFVNYRDSAQRVYERLKREGLPAGLYHGALDQQQRRIALEKLANGTTPVLVSTDLASRGLDLPAIDAVVHYHEPADAETWTHRNGRTARQGAAGRVYVIKSREESRESRDFKDLKDLKDLKDISEDGGCSQARAAASLDSRLSTLDSRGIATLYINAGKREKISKGDVAGYLMKQGGLEKDEVGRIMVDDHYALAAVPAAKARDVMQRLAAAKLKGQRVRVSEA